ncbi:S-layer homology domain-containing protein, partial [Deinococcus pimensis]|uniref:S-layer homology domain-containing protein n=1 Tax=Deinococcus pimensis TaxID=309888 RepID=UPI0005EBB01F
MRNRILMTAALSGALGLGLAGAQNTTTTTQTQTTAPTQFRDVPAGHWAKDAVDLITQRGLIQGFPDGTFRGNENLTRYQAALIFFRLLQSGNFGNLNAQDQTTVARGMQEVAAELAAVSTRVGDLERAAADQQARL